MICKKCKKNIVDKFVSFNESEKKILSVFEGHTREESFISIDSGVFCSVACLWNYILDLVPEKASTK